MSPLTAPLQPPADLAACKVCGDPAPLFDVVDFAKSCEERRQIYLPRRGVAIYYHRCRGCGFIFTTAFDRWSAGDFTANIYDDAYQAVDPDYREVRPRANASLVLRLFGAERRGLSLLDWGGGDGALARQLEQAGFARVLTHDPIAGSGEAPPGRFDIVTCFEVLEHVPDPRATVAAIAGRVDGLVLFSTLLQPVDIDRQRLGWWYAGPRNGHISLYSRAALTRLWRDVGYQVASFDDNLHLAFRTLPAFAQHLARPRTA